MTSHVGRLYALALALVIFFLTWAVVASRPWKAAATAADPRVHALAVREARLQREAKLVNAIAAARSHASAPAVRVVNLPPITITRTS
jgi:hypothetical protein